MDTIVLGQKSSSAAEVRNAVLVDLERKNAYRTASNQLAPPSLRTVQNRMAQLYAFDICAARHGAKEANRRYGDSIAARPVTRILQVVEVDHTPVDLWVVDEQGNVVGKPNLTVLLDRYSRCVVGFFLSLVGHDVETVFGAFRHALMPKDYVRERYPEIRGEWACYGWMEKVLADNGSEFAGRALRNALLSLGIVLEFCSAYQPNDKPFIERFLRTFNYGFIHHLKGTSLAKVAVATTSTCPLGFRDLCVRRDAVRAVLERPRNPEGWLSIPDAAVALGFKQEVAYHLVRRGLLPSTRRHNGRRAASFIAQADLDRFRAMFQPLARLASSAGISGRAALAWASSAGLDIASGPTVDGGRLYFVRVGHNARNTP